MTGKTLHEPPMISVITVVLNGRADLARTIESVKSQSYRRIEHIVVDGDSHDGTKDVIRQFQGSLARHVSEPDLGISDAFNKGLALSTGRWINFLNAGDTYAGPEILETLVPVFDGQEIVTGFAHCGASTLPNRVLRNADPLARRALISHQSSFVHRKVFDAIGRYDLDFQMRMDYEFWLRALARFDFHFVDRILTVRGPAGFSGRNMALFVREEVKANRRHLKSPMTSNVLAVMRRRFPELAPCFTYLRRHYPWLLRLWRD